ncbi:diguanylate cyclase [Nostoc sp. CHAB 5784]|uniref:GGDEF domain-containing protein n=1 Tax=Nostoc mirabile TaxID=2907820 RepID=UPI001E51F411|nr:diguanylate cyclase [Nostoc mirabile]MCC5665029.1 diguanylate cyclase [Nostoc mirabile CHAB5784]
MVSYNHRKTKTGFQSLSPLRGEEWKWGKKLCHKTRNQDLLPNTEIKGAIYVAQTIRQAVRDLEIPHAQSSVCDRVTISLGVVSIVPNSENSPQDLINAADKALYIAKQEGRDRVHAVGIVSPP